MKATQKLFQNLKPFVASHLLTSSRVSVRNSKKNASNIVRSGRLQICLVGLLVCSMLFSTSATRAAVSSHSESADVYWDYTARIDSVNFNKIRSMRNDDDWLYYEIRVFDSNNTQLFADSREGHLTKPNGSSAIKPGDFIAFTHPQGLWSNPFILNFRLRSTDVAVCTYTILNQSHESHDPNKQRNKWNKFVSSQQKAVVIGEIIALPIGAGIAYSTVSGAYLALLEGIGKAWDLISPPAEGDVDCDGPVVTGYWKYTGADLLSHTDNRRLTESINGRFRDRTFARKECEVVPDTEVFLSIRREQNMGGRFPTTPPPAINDRPATTAPGGVWAGTWVDQSDVSDSRIVVQVTNPTSVRSRTDGPRMRQCNVTAEAAYNVNIKELATPVNGQVEFEQGSSCIRPEQAAAQTDSSPAQPSRKTDSMYERKRDTGILSRPNADKTYQQKPNGGVDPRPPTPDVNRQSASHILKATPNISFELYEAYNKGTVVGYRLRYIRKADDGTVIKDVRLSLAGNPIR